MAKSKVHANGVALDFHHHRPNLRITQYCEYLCQLHWPLHAENVHCMYRELTHTPRFCPLPASCSVSCVKCRDQSLCQYNMLNTRPKMYRNPDNAATRADYAPSMAFRAMTSAPTPREAENVSGDGRVSAHPTIPGNLLLFAGCRRGARRSIRQRGRVARPSGGVVGVPGPLRASVGHDVLHSH